MLWNGRHPRARGPLALRVTAFGLLAAAASADALEIVAIDQTGAAVSGFRWLVEEDNTTAIVPGALSADVPSLGIKKTHAPVVAAGRTDGPSATVALPDGRYAVSVLPLSGYTLSGAAVVPGQTRVVVRVNAHPIPSAQISVLVYEDHQPLNSAPDGPAEAGLEGFSVVLYDPLGQIAQDAFGHPLGTSYAQNPDGTFQADPATGEPVVLSMGSGEVLTDANGEALVKFLAPGKYGVRAIPPMGEQWIQTGTMEGTPTIDAWVKAGEPPYFAEWGAFQWHAFFGFVRPTPLATVGTGRITGQVVWAHQARPPLAAGLAAGNPVPDCWVGLNDLGGADELVYAAPCGADGAFDIFAVPPGSYQLALWDQPLDAIIDFRTVTVAAGQLVDLGPVPVFAWFGTLAGSVFFDANRDGFRQSGEPGIPGQAVNLRYPDGSMYQATATDETGSYALREVFPFFHWLIAEVDFARFQATGMTTVVDAGGPLPYPGAPNTPQLQADGLPYRTETGEVLLQALSLYASGVNLVDWGKAAYPPGENGGVSGIVYYATTRAEDDPRFAAPDPWEPGVPRVQVALYLSNGAGEIRPLDPARTTPLLADVDNAPLGGVPGPEDLDRNGNGAFDWGDAVAVVHTDAWDDAPPEGCVGPPQVYAGLPAVDCAETIRTFHQVRPGVFDGGYAFTGMFPAGFGVGAEVPLAQGSYVVAASPPPGYEIQREQDKNVDFGDAVAPALLPPPCVGDPNDVPAELALFPGVGAPFAGETRPRCDRKEVQVMDGRNTAADFFVFTEVPKSARIWGMVLNDVALEFDPGSPNKGTNLAPRWLPISIRDFAGAEIQRTYTDAWGRYDALVPSTFSVNVPMPTGVAPNILTACLNDPGPVPDPADPTRLVADPFYDPTYGQICTQWDFWPGKTTRLDTPILPIGSFAANGGRTPCEVADGTPLLQQVSGPMGGPHVTPPPAGSVNVTLVSAGRLPVFDPANPSVPQLRDFGFGAVSGRVTLNGVPLRIMSWAADGRTIVAQVPSFARTGQLAVVRGDNGRTSDFGVTLHVGGPAVRVQPGGSIQAAIDAAPEGTVVLIAPGVYRENLILWKNVRLQGWGAYGTTLLGGPMTPAEQAAWTAKMDAHVAAGDVVLFPGERADFFLELGAAITVASRPNRFTSTRRGLVDGLSLRGALKGGGIFVHGYASYLRIANNRIEGNQGSFGGGIRVGTPSLVNATATGYIGSLSTDLVIERNQILHNGAIDGGGGVALFNGADRYRLERNDVCGNYSNLYGGGVAHFGLSPGGVLARNRIVGNEAFDEGGGVMIAGELVPAGAPAGTLTPGAGSVTLDANLVQGNLSGDDGGGVRALMVNGADVQRSPATPSAWWSLALFNNLVVNNVSADIGGGISLDDAARVSIAFNTVAHNDSTATGIDAFGGPCVPGGPVTCTPEAGQMGGLVTSVPQPAGIVARGHSAGLRAAFAPAVAQEFSDPLLESNVIWHNRSFHWDATLNGGQGGLLPAAADPPVYWDLAVYGTAEPRALSPRWSLLGAPSAEPTNVTGDPAFLAPYLNTFRATSAASAMGNFVTVSFPETGFRGDYHLGPASAALGHGGGTLFGTTPLLANDIDGQPRPITPDVGADER